MKKMKILFPILGVSSIVAATTPLMSCGKNEKVTLEFRVSGKGTLSFSSVSIPAGSKWSEIQIPTVTPDSGYVFMGWFIGNAAVKYNTTINADTIIFARFMQKIDLLTVEDGDGWKFTYHDSDNTAWLKSWPKTSMLVVPKKVKYDNKEYTITSISISNETVLSTKSFFIPESVTSDIDFPHPLGLGYISVDPNNSAWTSSDEQGKPVNCLIHKEDKKLVMGCENSTIPNDIEIIGNNAFDGVQIDKVTIPESVKEIQEYAFFKSTIDSIFIPKNVENIGNLAFGLCKRAQTITFSPDIAEIQIGISAFGGCSRVTSIVLPEALTTINKGTFAYCTNLQTLHIGSKVSSIIFGEYTMWDYDLEQYPTFYECNNLETIEIDEENETYFSGNNKNSIMSINNDNKKVLHLCTNEKIPSDVDLIDQGAFAHNTKITNITIPNNVTELGTYSFTGCKKLVSVSIDDSLEQIDYGAFCNCPELKNVSINNDNSQLVEIGEAAFYNCSSMKSFFLPKSIKTIRDEAFSTYSHFDNNQINYGGSKADWENVHTESQWRSWLDFIEQRFYAFRYVKCIDNEIIDLGEDD